MEFIKNAEKPKIDIETGNVVEGTWFYWSYICQDGEKVTDEYASIESVSDQFQISPGSKDYDNRHYIVGKYDGCHKYYGVMALERDQNGLIIPHSDTLVVPYLYSNFEFGGLKTLIASIMVKGYPHYTYVDIDPKSRSYGKQLVPMLLTEASAYKESNNEFKGFARCRYKGKVGYLPRNVFPIYEDIPSRMLSSLIVKRISSTVAEANKISKTALALQEISAQYGDFEDVIKADKLLKELGIGVEEEAPKQYIKNKKN